ncbi:non-ribosomal peptide synthetase [Rhodococcus aetherivorans]|uniref:non-ribosomal peptide synthetase n=3 Tax=Rhodococcus TaxID=1827 RepID=UPI0005C9130F|nr:non-ribosomal peptide synthetase [Rhodococcus aetherivorans]
MSTSQRGLWFAQQLTPDVPFTIAQYLDLHGPLDADLIRAACNQAAREVESGTLFLEMVDGEPWQRVIPDVDDYPGYLDLRGDDDPEAEARRWMDETYTRPLDPLRDRLIATTLIQLADEHFYLFTYIHHLALDGHGGMVMLGRSAELYTAWARGEAPAPLAAMSLEQIAEHELAYVGSTRQATDREHWRQRLVDLPPPVTLAAGSAAPTMPCRHVGAALTAEVTDAVAELARDANSTDVPIVVAAFAAYLARMTGTTDVALSLPVSARTTAPLRRSAGSISNIVPLRVGVEPGVTVAELVRRVQVELTGALRHQRYRYEDMLRDLHAVGDHRETRSAFGPVVNLMMFNPEYAYGDITGEYNLLSTGPVDDLSVNVYAGIAGRSTRVDFEANPRLYGDETLTRHHRRFLDFLGAFARSADHAVGDLPLAAPGELTGLVPARGPHIEDVRLLPDVLTAHAGSDRVAVRDGAVALTYRELDERSTALARRLIACGAGPDDRVAVLLPRSVGAVVALWAVAKAGAAYTPIDPGAPALRLAELLRDVPVAVCGDDVALPDGVTRVDPAGGEVSPAPFDAGERLRPLHPDHLAWVIHTSGSTGTPKAVAVGHRGLAGLVATLRERYPADAASRVLHLAAPSFDASLQELLLAFDTGATLVVCPPDVVGGPDLAALLREQAVTHAITAPAVLAITPEADLPALRMLDAGGEALAVDVADRWSRGRTMLNAYGPTEATVLATLSEPLRPGGGVPIGAPVHGVTAVVLDARLHPVPVGAVGELYLGGPAVARGYLGDPALTAARFVASPFGRVYRTGDLVRWSRARFWSSELPETRTGGGDVLEFVGRADRQVKIRGYRIEPGEVEAALTALGDVASAAVVVRGDTLAAYVVGDVEPDDVHARLAERLPAYLRPATVTVLDALPLTPGGKIDRRALPTPAVDTATGSRTPTGPTETLVAQLMCEIVGVDRVGADANFFALGGHSLGAAQLAARLGAALGRDVHLRDVFDHPTVAGLAAAVDAGPAASMPAPTRSDDDTPAPLAPAQRRLWLLAHGDTAAYHLPFALHLDGTLDVAALRAAVGDVLDRHEILRTVYTETGPRQRVRPVAEVLPALDVEPVDPADVDALIAEWAAAPFDLATGIPLRVRLLRVGPDRHVVAVVAHHIAMDGASFVPLTLDLAAAYAARAAGHGPRWEPLSLRYSDYARWHRALLGDADDPDSLAARELAHWTTTLAGLGEAPTLPTDRPRPGRPGPAESLEFAVPAARFEALRRLAAAHDATAFMAVHAAVAVWLSAWTGGRDVAVGSGTAGREHPDLERLVGMFVGTVALRLDVDSAASFAELLAAARRADLDAYAHATVPFDRVVDALGFAPFQVMLAYDNVAVPDLALPGLAVRAEEIPSGRARFDVEIAVRELPDGSLCGRVIYDGALFERATVAAAVARLHAVLDAAVAAPQAPVGDLELGAPEVVLADPGPVATLPELLAAHPLRVSAPGGAPIELIAAATPLARHLIERGLGPEDRVAILLPRSVDSVRAVAAVALTGAAFVPVDPAQPAVRIAQILADAGVRHVVARPGTSLPDGVALVDPAAGSARSAPITDADRVRPLRPDHAAYLVYTSGSTGVPKGVVVTHRGLAPLVASLRSRMDLDPQARVLHFASPAFDASVLEYLLAAAAGGTLVVAPPDVYGGEDLLELLRAERITHWFSTPAVPAQLDPAGLDALRVLAVGGEAWPAETAARWAPGRTMLNVYGPTETTVLATASAPLVPGERLTIGTGLDGVTALVLGPRLRPVPVGVVGELYLAGPGLARGYLGMPSLTASRFVASPFGGGRMYRTGDLVRWSGVPFGRPEQPKGHTGGGAALEFVGRVDHQVKLRGFRIELGEIDATLTGHPAVAAAVTVVRGEALVAYVHGPDPARLDPAELREFVAARLPRHMVPATVTVLDALPLTSTGKVDRAALPEPTADPDRPSTGYRSAAEELVAGVVAALLDVPAVAADDDFFALGGNSLLATQLAARLGAVAGHRVGVREIFEHPTVAGLAVAVSDPIAGERLPLLPTDDTGPVPLAPAQQRMWLANRLDVADAAPGDHVAFAVDLAAGTDLDALAVAAADVIARHAVLRTVHPDGPDGPTQRVLPGIALDLAPHATPADLDDALTEFARAGFDLTVDPPLRTRLYRTGAGYTLAVVLHHIAVDGLSLLPLGRDLALAYAARRDGRTPAWPPLPVTYRDYARWQHTLLGDPADPDSLAARQLAHWTRTLAGAPPLLALPTDRPRGDGDGAAGRVRFSVPAELHAAVDKLARAHDATTFMVVHAALAVLLATLTAAEDVTVGTPVSGRVDPMLDDVAGMFVGTVALRLPVPARATFAELLADTRRVDLDAFAHADVPFDRVVDALGASASRHHPVFQVMLAYESFALDGLDVPGVTGVREISTGTARFDLEVTVRETRSDAGTPTGLDGVLTYDRGLFDHDTVAAWAPFLLRILDVVTADPAVAVGGIDLLGPDDDASAPRPAPDTATLPALVAEQARRRPDAVALTHGADTLTYAQLHARSGALAEMLAERGLGVEDVVAVALPRSLDLVVAILAVARAGAVYLPLDVTHPPARLRALLDDAAPAAVLCDTGFAVDTDVALLHVDAPEVRQRLDAGAAFDAAVPAGAGAYLIYTSGSTGIPKGVLVGHEAAAAVFAATGDVGFGPRDVWTLFHSPAFDFSVWEMWGALTTGGRLVVVDHYTARDPGAFAALLDGEGVTVLNQTPTAFGQLATVDTALPTLRLLIFGGEALDPGRVRPWLADRPHVRAVNMFGITETTVHVTRGPAAEPGVGRPLPGFDVQILDRSLRRTPPGTVGELYVAGGQLARGYRGRPGLTATRFVAAPGGARRYRTGDLGRRGRDGVLHHRGRADDQIELRGYRIEPGEIEAALLRCDGVTQAVVVLRDDRLVAYLVGGSPTGVLRALRRTLPDYLVPAAAVALDALPRTANGKLDRAALPAPAVAPTGGLAPHGPLEELVAEVYRELLGAGPVGAGDDFFALGGNSLLATRLAGRLADIADVDVTVRDVFDAATVADLAALLAARAGTGRRRAPLVAADDDTPAPLSPAQQRLWFVNRLDPGSGSYNLPFAVRLDGRLDVAALTAAVADVLDRHRTLRTVYPDATAQVVRPVARPGLEPVAVPAEGLDEFVREFAAPGFDLTRETPVRMRLYRLAPRRHVLAVVVHHIAADEWSLTPLLRDLVDAYTARRAGQAPRWAPLPVQYTDFSRWQRAGADGQLAHWTTVLAGLPDEVTLPGDRPRPARPTGRGATHRMAVDHAVAEGVSRLARDGRATTFMVLHAALAVLLARHGAGDDIAVGTVVAGRGDPQLDALVGMFAGTLVLRTPVDPDATFADLLAEVHARDLAAYTHPDAPFETLVERLNPARNPARHPLFQVALSLRRPTVDTFELPGLTARVLPVADEHANFDVQLVVTETGTETGTGVDLEFAYATDLYDAGTVAAFADRYVAILRAAVADPAVRIGDIDLLTERERAALVPAAGPEPAPARTLWQWLAAGAARGGDGVAVRDGDTELTYPQLLARADALAARLHAAGARPGTAVACALPRSLDSVVAVWGIVRLGAAPMLVDPAQPAARLAAMLGDATVGVTGAAHRGSLPAAVTWLDVAGSHGDGFHGGGVAVADPGPGAPAYLVFTSGTSGNPKGVTITHRGVSALAEDLAERFAAAPGDRMLHVASPSFDAAMLELLVAGTAGATLVVAGPDAYGGDALADLLAGEHITHACVTPSALATVPPRALPDLRVLMLGGEAVSDELVARWGAGRRLYNGYGPAEATVFATCSPPLAPGADVVIGTPVRGVQAVVLDERLRPVPTGVAGELYLAGERLADGYRDDPGRTARRFVAADGGRRRYRTGDLARWARARFRSSELPETRTGGGVALRFVGRSDDQVKLRGVRIEPGEVDAALRTVPGVEQAATVVRDGALVSYVVPAGVDAEDARGRLRQSLPAHLVPVAVVPLDAVPRTAHGKLDVARLPAPDLGGRDEPGTGTEALVARVYGELLDSPVGRTDDFFAVGGNSLLATVLVGRLREETGVAVPLRLIFEHPTVEGLAAALDAGGLDVEAGPVPVHPRPARIPLSRAQRRLWGLSRLDPDAYLLRADVRLTGPLDVPALEAALGDVVARHEILRTRIVVDEQGPHQVLADRGVHWDLEGTERTPRRLRLAVDHAAADGASLAPLLRDLAVAYAARAAGQAPRWEPLPLQYADYALWEQARGIPEADAAHWRRALDGLDPVELPTQAGCSETESSEQEAGTVAFEVPADVRAGIAELARAHGATEFMVLHAALSVLLARVGAGHDVAVAAVVSARRWAQVEDLVGPFLETLVLRARVEPDMPFAGLLAQVRDFDVAALDHAGVPYEQILAGLPGRAPQVALALQDFTLAPTRIGDLTVEAEEIVRGAPKFDLQFAFAPAADGYAGTLVHDASRFAGPTARRLADRFVAVLRHLVAAPGTTVGDLPVDRPAAPLTGAAPVPARPLPDLLRATAAAHPDREALREGDTALTYRELDARSDALADELRAAGAGPGTVVPIDRPRGLEYVLRLWAITKTGAAFTGAPDAAGPAPANVAYVVSTSGSTGAPKRVAVTHAGLAPLAAEAARRYRVGPGDRVLQGYHPAFDAALLEILLAHTTGATLVVAPPEVYAGEDLQRLLRAQRITHYLSTPAVLGTLDPHELPDLRVVASGGETLPPALAARWTDGRHMLDAYGPTEATIVATLTDVDGRGGIGRPVPGTVAHVLDARLRPVPDDAVGELYLAGASVALGYLGAPALTAQRFVAAPGGTRRYRTGDLVHRRPDGTLAFRGRTDRQLKVRGVRIEPGELEAALLAQPGIRHAVALAAGGALVAFAAADPGVEPSRVLAELADVVPPHRMPTRLRLLPELPTTVNGKLDTAALRDLDTAGDAPADDRPLTDVEDLVVTVAESVLGARPDIHAGFFAAGGDSLSAVVLAARLADAFGTDVPVRAVLQAPTLAALAAHIRDGDRTRIPLRRYDDDASTPLAPAQQRLWLLGRAEPGSAAYTVPVALHLTGDLDTAALAAAVADVAARHEILRTAYPDGVAAEVDPPVLEAVPGTDPAAAVAEVITAPFDLTADAPLRIRLIELGAHEWVLAAAVHHIAFDGGSVAPLLTDLQHAYTARVAGAEPIWWPLPVRYRDYARWQRDLLGDPADPDSLAARQLDHWATTLAGLPDTPLPLPTDRPRPARPSHRGGAVTAHLDAGTHRRVRDVARAHDATGFMVLHAALAALLARRSGRADIAVGTAVAGRADPRLHALVGMFVGTLTLRTTVAGDEPFGDLLRRIRTTDLDALAHADVPFDRVVARVAPVRGTHHPLFQVLLAHRTVPAGEDLPQLPGLRVREFDAGTPAAQFDLTWDVTERDGDGGIDVRLVYATDLFDPATAGALLDDYVALLGAALADPGTAVGDLAASAPAPLSAPAAAPRTLPQLLAATARTHPGAIAVRAGAVAWTYAGLAARADVVAGELRARGVTRGDVVAVAVPRGECWPLAVWAVARTGAAWVSVDPAQPPARVETVLRDSGATVGLTVAGAEPVGEGIDWVDLTGEWEAREIPAPQPHPDDTAAEPHPDDTAAEPHPDDTAAEPHPDDTAYLIYTSGSTGTPKGVAVPHRGLTAVVDAQRHVLGVAPGSRVLHAASHTFDASVFELLAAHAHGATLVVAPDHVYAGAALQRLIVDEHVTHVVATPTVLATLDPDALGRPVTVLSEGEALTAPVVERWRRHRLLNGYGPTEFTIAVSFGGPFDPGARPTVGAPVAGATAHVLDARLHPVPAGVIGELYVTGAGLARGYHGRSGLTATRFVADPHGEPGTRLYRTGDLARVTADGELDVLGRVDEQIQLHGIRVEPAEIDAVLTAADGVEAAVTVAVPGPAGGTVLASYAQGSADAAALRTRVAAHLPRALRPAAITVVDALPLLPSGKVDRAALPRPDFASPADGFVPPDGATAETVAAVFARHLGRPLGSVSADLGFFDLGGTSLGAVAVAADLRAELDRDVPLDWLLTAPTVADLADRIDHGGDDTDPLATLVPLAGRPGGTPLFCVHPISGMSWCYTGLAPHLTGVALYGLQATRLEPLPRTVAEFAARYLDRIRTVQPEGPYHLLGWSLGGTIAHEMAVQLHEAGQQVASLILLDTLTPDTLPDVAALPDEPVVELEVPGLPPTFVAEIRERALAAGAALEEAVTAHTPRVLDGDALLFRARPGGQTGPDLAASWRRHVRRVAEHDVPYPHSDLTTPGALALIGPTLARHLTERQSSAPVGCTDSVTATRETP